MLGLMGVAACATAEAEPGYTGLPPAAGGQTTGGDSAAETETDGPAADAGSGSSSGTGTDPDPGPTDGTTTDDPTAGAGFEDHEHFDAECELPGVVTCRSWRVQAEIDEDDYGPADPGDENYPTYDPWLDAVRISVVSGEALSQVRHEFPHTSGSVWLQYEMRIDEVVFTDTFEDLGMKLWRAQDDTKAGCTDERRLTHNVGFGPFAHVYHRDGCGVPEVRDESGDEIDDQPGGDTQCLYNGTAPHPACFRWKGDTWIRLTYHMDFAGQNLRIWARRADDGLLFQIVEFPVEDWNDSFGVDVAGPWLHSTSRTHGNWPQQLPTFSVYARNMIVSTESIAP